MQRPEGQARGKRHGWEPVCPGRGWGGGVCAQDSPTESGKGQAVAGWSCLCLCPRPGPLCSFWQTFKDTEHLWKYQDPHTPLPPQASGGAERKGRAAQASWPDPSKITGRRSTPNLRTSLDGRLNAGQGLPQTPHPSTNLSPKSPPLLDSQSGRASSLW